MRLFISILIGLAVIGLAGCTGSSSPSPSTAGPGLSGPGLSSPGPSVSTSASRPPQTAPAPQAGPAEPETQAGARTAAEQFDGLYAASRFADSWHLLAPAAKQHVPQDVWVKVHAGCPSGGSGLAPEIKTVTVFGNAAIVTETLTGASAKLGPAENVFNYVSGHWSYAPGNLSIYSHGSVAADIAAAKAAGLCASWKSF